ncbi:retrovirus-related Pol polyprotein from transposon TNT 1-94 [Trichonephila clavipes]|nr:retrovirus-related Pol polyprotein from transposon TNT 1-94 [Trichonephila clavipes]
MDLCGPMPTESQGGNKYFLSIIDDYSRKVTVFPIRNKSDVFHAFIRFQKRAERFLSKKVIAVRTDGGLEFCNKDMDNFLTELGIKHEVTNSYTPEMNGVAERFNLIALDGIKTLLKSSEVPHKFWGEALLCFTYAWNRICHKDGNKTPFEKYSGRKPSVLHLIPFGCLAYAGVPKQIKKKFDMRAKMGTMMGYAQRTKGYRIWLIDKNKLVETINGFSDLSEQQEALMVEVTIPNCYKQAIRSRDASKWHDAMDKEINVMIERKVWDLVDHPDNIKFLENRWVYTIKYDENNKIVRYKARLVARDTVIYMKQPTGYEIDNNKVYDMIIFGKEMENVNFVLQLLQKNFDLKIMGKTKKLLGIEFEELDSDFATNRDDRVPMGGFITFIDETPISWRTFKQKFVSLSTMEAEYVSLTEAAKEFIWLKNTARGGRVRSTTPAEDRYIVLSAKRNRRTTAQQVANQFLAASGKQISRKTVARRLRGGGLYARRPVVCVPLTRQPRTARLQWCREHHNWTEQDWACVLFSEESRFSLSSDCRRQLIWRESGTVYRPENIQEKDRYPTCSIMVWAGIMINGRTRLHVVANGTMTGQRYIHEVLLPHVRLFRGAVGDKFIFMDDNATCHRTLAVQDCLDSKGIYSTSRMASAFSRSKPHRKCVGCFGEASCWSKLCSDKQELPHPCTQRNGINCLNSCWIMLCKVWYDVWNVASHSTVDISRTDSFL